MNTPRRCHKGNRLVLRTAARYECVPATFGAGVISLQLMKGLAMSRTIKHMNPTSGRSTRYGSGRLIRVFRDIGHIFSSLYPSLAFCFLVALPRSQGLVGLRQTFVRRCHAAIVRAV